MKYTIKEREFKLIGFEFLKLYANNYKCYHKEINYFDIWCWVKGKDVEIDDWYGLTGTIVDFFNTNLDNPRVLKHHKADKFFKTDCHWMVFYIDRKTGEIFTKKEDVSDSVLDQRAYERSGKKWYDLVLRKEYREIFLEIDKFKPVAEAMERIK